MKHFTVGKFKVIDILFREILSLASNFISSFWGDNWLIFVQRKVEGAIVHYRAKVISLILCVGYWSWFFIKVVYITCKNIIYMTLNCHSDCMMLIFIPHAFLYIIIIVAHNIMCTPMHIQITWSLINMTIWNIIIIMKAYSLQRCFCQQWHNRPGQAYSAHETCQVHEIAHALQCPFWHKYFHVHVGEYSEWRSPVPLQPYQLKTSSCIWFEESIHVHTHAHIITSISHLYNIVCMVTVVRIVLLPWALEQWHWSHK